MLLSNCDIFSKSPSSSLEAQTAHQPDPATKIQPAEEPYFSNHSDLVSSALSKLSDWSSSAASTATALFCSEPSSEKASPPSTPSSDYSKLSLSSVTSWLAPPASEAQKTAEIPVQPSARLGQSLAKRPDTQEHTSSKGERTTTFTFVLFGAASTTAIYLLVRNRRTMNKLQTAKSLAYRDARAWRKVALDFARINALATSRVQSLVAASLRDGQAGGEIARQIERELEEASRLVAQRRNWIKDQDRKDAESARQHSFGDAWGDIFDPVRAGFFFGSRTGRRESDFTGYGRCSHKHVSRHDDVSSEQSATPTPERSAKQRWQRVAGLSAVPAAAPETKAEATSSKDAASEAGNEQPQLREEWIGDVENAIRERDLKSSSEASRADKAAADAFSGHDSEVVEAVAGFASREVIPEEGDHLLPVSDLHIATGGRLQDELDEAPRPSKAARSRTELRPTKVQTTVTSTPEYSYPISDRFRDLEDIFVAAWDDNFAGLASPATRETASATDKYVEGVAARPNSALFEKLRSQRTNAKTKAQSSAADETEFMAKLLFPSAPQASSALIADPRLQPEVHTRPTAKEQELAEQLEKKQDELVGYKYKIDELSERLDTMREMCHDLTDEAQRREKTHKIQIEQLDQKVGLFTVWAEEVQRRLGLDTPPFFASLRKPLKRD